jgi:hypothetical protein
VPPTWTSCTRYPDQKQRQLQLGTKWESRVLTAARYGSSLLTCAPGPPARTRKRPGGGDVDAFLGVKGSPVQIRPSRPEGPGQKGFRVLTRAPFRSSGANREPLSQLLTAPGATCPWRARRLCALPGLRLGRCCPACGWLCRLERRRRQPRCDGLARWEPRGGSLSW